MSRGLNKVMMLGWVDSPIEMRHTSNGRPVTAFAISIPHNQGAGNKSAFDRFDIIAWGGLAEMCNRELSQSQQVYIEGKLQTRYWQDSDGRNQSRTEIIATQVLPINTFAEK